VRAAVRLVFQNKYGRPHCVMMGPTGADGRTRLTRAQILADVAAAGGLAATDRRSLQDSFLGVAEAEILSADEMDRALEAFRLSGRHPAHLPDYAGFLSGAGRVLAESKEPLCVEVILPSSAPEQPEEPITLEPSAAANAAPGAVLRSAPGPSVDRLPETPPEPDRSWLADRVHEQQGLTMVGSVAALFAGLVVCFVQFWVAYGVIVLTVNWWWPMTHAVRMLASGAVMALLGVGAIWQRKDFPADLKFGTGRENLLTPESARSAVRGLAWAACVGPNLLASAWFCAHRLVQLLKMDRAACAAALARAAEGQHLVPCGGLPESLVGQLVLLNGVAFVTEPSAGIVLNQELRDELRTLG
jgi:hypothetical protein